MVNEKHSYEELIKRNKELEIENSALKNQLSDIEIFKTTNLIKAIADNSQQGIIVYDKDLKFLVWNKYMEHISGIPASDIIGKNSWGLFPFLEENNVISNLKNILKNGSSFNAEINYKVPKTGKEGWAIHANSPLYDSSNEIIGILTIVVDITDRKKAEQELLATKQAIEENAIFNENLLQIMPFGIDIVTNEGVILYQDNYIKKLIGREALNEICWEIYRDDKIQCDECPLRSEIKIGETKTCVSNRIFGDRVFEISHTGMKFRGKTALLEIFNDITERNKLEQEQLKLAKIVEKSLNEIYIFDSETFKFEYVNQQALKNLGYSWDEIKNMTPIDIKPHFTEDSFREMVQPLFDNSLQLLVFETIHKRKDGTNYVVDVHLQLHSQGSKKYFFAVTQDITERKSIIEKLNQSREDYIKLFEDHIAVKLLIDPETGSIIDANYAAESYYGYSRAQLRQMNIDQINIATTEQIKTEIEKALHNKKQNFEFKHKLSDGTIRDVEVFSSKISFMGKEVLHSIIHDITDRKKIEKELIAAKEKAEESEKIVLDILNNYNIAQNIAQVGNWEWNLQTNKVYWTDGVYQIFEVEKDKFNPDFDDNSVFIVPEDKEKYYSVFQNCLKTGEPLYYDFKIITPKGNYKYLNAQGKVLLDEKNVPIKFIGTVLDVTSHKMSENELIKAKEKAEESDRLKTAFLQNMSHEIRTPMNAIMGFSELLLRHFNDKSKLQHFTKIINQRCNDLLIIIDDILDISKIESGQLTVSVEPCNLNLLFTEIRLFFIEQQQKLNKQHIKFIFKFNSDSSRNIIATDTVKLKQILINLLGNAFKFTDRGQIEGGCHDDGGNFLTFYVSDTGIGIPPDKQEIIFDRFIQIDPSPNRLYGGTGLGLSIVKGLVTLLGGKIWLESTPGAGTTFYFTIPYKTIEISLQTDKEEFFDIINNLQDKTVLIVEDDNYNASYIKEIVSETQAITIIAQYGQEAVEKVISQSIDLVLMDIGLPDISGFEAARQILIHKPGTKIIAQTAFASSDDKRKALEAGCIDYISKPIKSNMLLSLLNKYLG